MFERILKQQMMNRVLYALVPLLLFSIYLFGLRILAVVAVANLAAYFTEYLFVSKKKGGKVSMAAFVTASLVSLSLPPTIPLWISAVSAIVSIAFGKMVFGGFGTNVFNPAILGRTFVYISFPNQMTISWLKPLCHRTFPVALRVGQLRQVCRPEPLSSIPIAAAVKCFTALVMPLWALFQAPRARRQQS